MRLCCRSLGLQDATWLVTPWQVWGLVATLKSFVEGSTEEPCFTCYNLDVLLARVAQKITLGKAVKLEIV